MKKTLEVKYGEEKAKKIKKNMSLGQKKYNKDNPEVIYKRTKHFIGKKQSEETCKKRSISCKGKNKGRIAWNKGLTKETDIRILQSAKKSSLAQKGKKKKPFTKNHRKNMSKSAKIVLMNKKERDGELGWPNYTPFACEKFKEFDKKNKTQGRYAVYGNGEFRIPNTAYFPDYINFDLKLIIECDDPKHFDKDGNQLPHHIQREEEIKKFYPDFKFLRFKTEDMYKILEITTA